MPTPRGIGRSREKSQDTADTRSNPMRLRRAVAELFVNHLEPDELRAYLSALFRADMSTRDQDETRKLLQEGEVLE